MTRIAFIKAGHPTVRQHFTPPLGVLSLAAYIRDKLPDIECRITDMAPRRLSIEQAVSEALSFDPDIIGISAMSMEAQDLAGLASLIKEKRPGLPLMAGGPHPTTAREKVFEEAPVDLIVIGEGELTLVELIPRILHGEDISSVTGIGYKKGGEFVFTGPRGEILDLDSLPLPAYDLLDLSLYWGLPRFGTTFVRKQYAPVSTSRACPYHCTYCHRIFGTRYRAQSPEKVLQDLETLQRRFGVREIQFVDDCFNLSKKRVADICRGIVDKKLDFAISFPNGLRGDIMDADTLDHLKTAGTYRITYAIETASPRVQKFIKKNVKLDKLKEVIAMTDARNIMVDGFFMVGFPGESRSEIETTFRYAFDSRLHTANFWFVTPFPGTELFEQARELGFDIPEHDRGFHYFDTEIDLSEVPHVELKKMVKRNFLRFYLNPWRLWRILKLFPNKKQLPWLLGRFLKISLRWS